MAIIKPFSVLFYWVKGGARAEFEKFSRHILCQIGQVRKRWAAYICEFEKPLTHRAKIEEIRACQIHVHPFPR
jgi:hypothetical protein